MLDLDQRAEEATETAQEGLENARTTADQAADQSLAMSEEMFSGVRDWVENTDNSLIADHRAQARNSVNMLVIVGATLIVGIVVYAQIEAATPSPQNTELNNTQDSVTSTVASSFDLASVLPIVLIAGAILFYLRGFGGGGGGRR